MAVFLLSEVFSVFRLLTRSGGKSLNEIVVRWHLPEEVPGWVAVPAVAIILQFKEWYFPDPALSLVIILYIMWGVGAGLKTAQFNAADTSY